MPFLKQLVETGKKYNEQFGVGCALAEKVGNSLRENPTETPTILLALAQTIIDPIDNSTDHDPDSIGVLPCHARAMGVAGQAFIAGLGNLTGLKFKRKKK